MPRPQRPCLDCQTPTRNPRGRCRPCQQKADWHRNRQPGRKPYEDSQYRALRRKARQGDYGGCVDCGTFTDLTLDHIKPLSKGGTNDPANLAVRCRPCNSAKGADR